MYKIFKGQIVGGFHDFLPGMLLMQSKVALDAAANVFYEYSQGDPKAKVLSPKCFCVLR